MRMRISKSEGAVPLRSVSVCTGRLPAHALKLQFNLQAAISGLNLAVPFLDVKRTAHCI